MIEDKKRWNVRHVEKPMRHEVSDILKRYISYSKIGDALDLACGTGRNTHFLNELNFKVDAIDFSDYALRQIKDTKNITKIEVDLDFYNLKKDAYDLVINTNYLNRRLMIQMKDALKKDGLLIFETFIQAHTKPEQGSMNSDYLLKTNELLEVFRDFEVIYYEEKDGINLRGEENKTASLVARKI